MPYSHILKVGLIAASLACASIAASAANVVVNATADLSRAGISAPYEAWAGGYFNGGSNASAIPSITPMVLSAGDSFELNISFLAGQKIIVSSLSSVWPLLLPQAGQGDVTTNFSSTVELLDAGGAVLASASKSGSETYNDYIGEIFYGDRFGDPASITISGIRFFGDITASSAPARIYDNVAFAVGGLNVELVTSVSAVPEHSTIEMMLAGLAGFAVAGRRHRVASVQAQA